MMDTTTQPFGIHDLYRLFHQPPPRARDILPQQMPQPYRGLLEHENHMTETLETHHRATVTLEVLARAHEEPRYSRKILLRSAKTAEVVQFGIMQFDFSCCNDTVRSEILEEATPLGRILIQNATLRRISMHGLLEIEPDAELKRVFGLAPYDEQLLYGRLATIFTNDEPAVALLEVLAPER